MWLLQQILFALLIGTALEIFQVGVCSPFSQLPLCGDIQPNPGPDINQCLKFFHWNLNSICARDRRKINLIETYDTFYKFDIIAISESMLDQTVKNDGIYIEGFSREINRSEHRAKMIATACKLRLNGNTKIFPANRPCDTLIAIQASGEVQCAGVTCYHNQRRNKWLILEGRGGMKFQL